MQQPDRRELVQCLLGIRHGEPSAAEALYQAFAPSIRQYFQENGAVRDTENAVFATLVEAVRSVRELDISDPEELRQTVRHLCANRLFELRKTDRANAMTLNCRGEVVNRMFTALNRSEREVLLRSCVLLQRDDDIARDTSASVNEVRRTQAKARMLFRVFCGDVPDSNPMLVV